jgi:outer membrane protein with beta-barrel domain
MRRTLAVAAVLALPALAGAQEEPETVSMIRDTGVHRRPLDFSVLGGAPGFGLAGFGGGIRVGIPILSDGFLPRLNDGVFFETGAELLHWTLLAGDYNSITVPLHMRWNFYLARDWTVFATAGFEFSYYLEHRFFEAPSGVAWFNVAQGGVLTFGVGGGVLYNFSESVSLRLDATLSLLAIGLTFRF